MVVHYQTVNLENDFSYGVPDLDIFNKRAIMGFNSSCNSVYNYLGGKLLAPYVVPMQVVECLNKKYDTKFCLFETTSLYMVISKACMYDGMHRYFRYKGDTIQFLLTPEDIYPEMRDWFTEKNM